MRALLSVCFAVLVVLAPAACSVSGGKSPISTPTLSGAQATTEATRAPGVIDFKLGTKWKDVPGRRVYPNTMCLMAFREASRIDDPREAEPVLAHTLYACDTSDQWLSAVEFYPRAIAMTDGHKARLLDLQVACHNYKQRPVCRDAASKGVELP